MNKIQQRRLGEVATFIDYRGKTPHKTQSGVPLITAKIVKNGTILPVNEFISANDYESWMTRGLPMVGDVVITTEAPLGEVAQLRDAHVALAQRIITLRGKKDILDNSYLKYYLQSHEGQWRLKVRETGTTVTGIKSSELQEVLIPIPSFATQKRIAQVLLDIDEKIYSNKQINQNLEHQAQAIFKSWFVDFELFKDGKFVESELGPIPAGWRVVSLEDIALYNNEKMPASQAKIDTYISTENMLPSRGGIELASSVPSTGCVTVYAKNDVLLSNIRPYFRKIWYASLSGTCSTDVLCFRQKGKVGSEYLFCVLNDEKFFEYIMSGAKGTKMPRGDKRQMMSYRIVMPPPDTLENFGGILKPLIEHQRRNTMESHRLATLRDTLLPKLMSGEIDVSEVEI